MNKKTAGVLQVTQCLTPGIGIRIGAPSGEAGWFGICLLALLLQTSTALAQTWNKLEMGVHQSCGFAHVSGESSSDAVYFAQQAGYGTKVLKYNGSSLELMQIPEDTYGIYDLHGDLALARIPKDDRNRLAVIQSDGAGWQALPVPLDQTTTHTPRKLWSSHDNSLIVAYAAGGREVRYENGAWKYYGPNGWITDYLGISGADNGSSYYYAAISSGGYDIVSYRYQDAEYWSPVTIRNDLPINHVYGFPNSTSPGTIYGVRGARIYKWVDGEGATEMSHPLSGMSGTEFLGLTAVEGIPHVYGTNGHDGVILKLQGETWTNIAPENMHTVQEMWGTGSDLYVATDCEIWHFGRPRVPKRPVLVIPGIYGSYFHSDTTHELWNLHRGVHPDLLVIDPFKHAYDDLVQTLKNIGYVEGKDLFVVAYDWRLTPGPVDGVSDGHIEELSGYSITDTVFQYGVDYLGHHLGQAVEVWKASYSGAALESVDIISHSTGGLVARSYIQSDAYASAFRASDGATLNLPRVENLIMVAVPNRGAAGPWQAMENNFIADSASKYFMAKILNIAYEKVLNGKTITGFPAPITLESISTGGIPSKTEFINQYVPTFRSLLATYAFLYDESGDLTDVNSWTDVRNDLLLDLNNGLDDPYRSSPADASPFVKQVGKTSVFYADSVDTEYRLRYTEAAASNAVFRFDYYFEANISAGIGWYRGITEAVGDGTVPKESSAGQFINDSRVQSYRIDSGDNSHIGLMSNEELQQKILGVIDADWLAGDISTSLASTSKGSAIWNAWIDPVDMVVVDGAGRRFGFITGIGPVTEIPNSVWYGGNDGMGWIFGDLVLPLHIELTGQEGPYKVQFSGTQKNVAGGYEGSGYLPGGETKTAPVKLRYKTTFLPALLPMLLD